MINTNTQWINLDFEAPDWQCPDFPAQHLRKSFQLNAIPEYASIRFAAPGWADISINGKLITEDLMIPTVTQLDQHTAFCEYDVTPLLKTGENVIGALLGNGWFNPSTKDTWHFDKAPWRNYNRLFLELCADGEKIVWTDDTWKAN